MARLQNIRLTGYGFGWMAKLQSFRSTGHGLDSPFICCKILFVKFEKVFQLKKEMYIKL